MIRVYRDMDADTLERIVQATRAGIRNGLSPILERLFNGLQGALKEEKYKEAISFAKQISAQKDSPKRVKTLVTALKNRINKFAKKANKAIQKIKDENNRIEAECFRLIDEMRNGIIVPNDVIVKINEYKRETEKEKKLKKYDGLEYLFSEREYYLNDHIEEVENYSRKIEKEEQERKERAREQKMSTLENGDVLLYKKLEEYIEWARDTETKLKLKRKEILKVKPGENSDLSPSKLILEYNAIIKNENEHTRVINSALDSDKKELKEIGHRAALVRKSLSSELSRWRKTIKAGMKQG